MTNRAEDVAFNYIEEAHVTMSPQFHAGKISKNDLKVLVHNAIDAITALDAVKKAIFYGRELPAGFAEANALNGPCAPLILPELAPADSPNRYQASINIFHGILGVVTESGEMLEALAESLFETGAPLDGVNMREEVGDAFWYEAAIAKAFGFTFDNAQRVNIQKLRARFPDKFSEYDANNRNLFTERRILEGEPEAVPPGYRLPMRDESGHVVEFTDSNGYVKLERDELLDRCAKRGLKITISGPTGCGKGVAADRIRGMIPSAEVIEDNG